ncbi:Insect odorant-binding protein A10/Ejaculatory bulb-specific protein 3 [Trinorchestia longiramus]|nr:Insect odorant-binding protein A10/Ejaculatory bulb-specific protein 3 [Trinorchestia longiramus]
MFLLCNLSSASVEQNKPNVGFPMQKHKFSHRHPGTSYKMKLQISAVILVVLVVAAESAPQQQASGAQEGQKKIPLHLDPNLTLSKISQKDLDAFLGSKEAVTELVNCFESLRRCRARAGVSLVRDVRSLGKGGSCSNCSEAERKHTRTLVGNAIAGLQQHHPQEWKRLLPEIGFLL